MKKPWQEEEHERNSGRKRNMKKLWQEEEHQENPGRTRSSKEISAGRGVARKPRQE